MDTFIRIAWRNIWKNKRRTVISIAAITFSVAITIFTIAMMDGSHDRMLENAIRQFTGYVQIHKKGYQDDPGLEKSFRVTPDLKRVLKRIPTIKSYTFRLQTGALAATRQTSAGAFLVGIKPDLEREVTVFDDKIISGEYIDDSQKRQCVVGSILARNLNLKVGSKLVLLTQGYDGSTGAFKFTVRGIFRTLSPEMNRNLVLISLKDARNLLRADELISSIAIMTPSHKEVRKTAQLLRSDLSGKGFEVLGWKELMPELVKLVTLDSISGYVMLGMLLLVVVFGVLSTILSSVLERTREFGIMLALGTRPHQVVFLVLTEAFLLTMVGMVFGLIIGLGLSIWKVYDPITLPAVTESAMKLYGLENKLFFKIYPFRMAVAAAVIVFTSLLFSIYPAWWASNLKPDEAIRNINQ